MEVTINQKKQELQAGSSIAELVAAYGYNPGDGIAVAVNETVIPKDQWDQYILSNADEVTLIQAKQGGWATKAYGT